MSTVLLNPYTICHSESDILACDLLVLFECRYKTNSAGIEESNDNVSRVLAPLTKITRYALLIPVDSPYR